MNFWMGIDVSTTGVKTLLINSKGNVVGKAVTSLVLSTPKPLWSEQDPDDWWAGTIKSISQVLIKNQVSGNQIQGIGLTGQMHGLTAVGNDGEVLCPAILCNDQRTAAKCDEIRQILGKSRLIQITGNDALTGVYATDRAGASGTILFDLVQRDWSPEVLEALGSEREWLPPVHEGIEVTGKISVEASLAIGLPTGIPVYGGGGDQAAAAVGTGAVEDGIVSLSLGTSGVVFASSDRAIIEPEGRLHAFCHAIPDKWHLMGVMLSAAGSLRWHRDTFQSGMFFDKLVAPDAQVPPGCEGLLFLPQLTGERTPLPDPLARGAFVGLTVRHTLPHLTRAVLEGVAFGLRDSFELMQNAGLAKIEQVRVTGGGADSPLWLQILSDVLNVELATISSVEGAAYGAALLAATGSGAFSDINEACTTAIQITGLTKPSQASTIYQEIYSLYRNLYPALRASFNGIAKIIQVK